MEQKQIRVAGTPTVIFEMLFVSSQIARGNEEATVVSKSNFLSCIP